MDNDVLNLNPRKKKGLLRIVFSRVGIMLILIILQLGVLMSIYRWFNDYFEWFTVVQWIFSLCMIFYLFNCSMDSSGKLTWLVLIMLFTVPASFMFWWTQNSIGYRVIERRIAELIDSSKDKIRQDPDTFDKPELIESGTDDLSTYLCRSGVFPIFENTSARYFNDGIGTFEAMLEELKKAEKFIFLEYFIIDEGYMWGRILKILADKAAEGVDVRVMYDGMCEVTLLPHNYPKKLEKLGIKCKPFMEIKPFFSTQYNYRDHRKIMVIDGKVCFSGGVNLADEYINKIDRFGYWKDSAVMLKGKAVASFTLMFLQMWNIDEKEPKWKEAETYYLTENDGYVMPYADCPLDEDKVGEMVYMDILNRAKSYVYIMTPYLILDNELETSIKFAAQRGIDVRIILPGRPDKKAVYALAKSHYKSLVDAGVKIYEYTPGFVHSKVFISDDEKAVVGTINLDYRSLYHHYECATYLYRTDAIRDIYKDFEKTLAECRQVTHESIRNEKIQYKIAGAFMKLIAPLM